MREHTPRQWSIRFPGAPLDDAKAVYDGNRHIATFHDPEERERAVHAVNNFDGLVAALEELEWIQPLDESEPYCAECFGCQSDGHVPGCQLAAAIAKAKED